MHDEVIHTTASHPWLTADAGWLRAGQLHLSEPVRLLDGATATVVALRTLPGVGAMWDLSLDATHTFAVGEAQTVVHNCGGEKTTEDLYAFGSKNSPRNARPMQDFGVENSTDIVKGQQPPNVSGASTFTDPAKAPLSGNYHMLPAGTELPDGLGVYADGEDVGGSEPSGHRTIYPTRDMSDDEFNDLYQSLPWEWAGKK